MTTTINAQTVTPSGLIITPDSNGDLQLQSNGTPVVTVTNTYFVGINNTAPSFDLTVNGNVQLANIKLLGSSLSSTTGQINLGSTANLIITGGTANYVLTSNGSGGVSWTNVSSISASVVGNTIPLGTNTAGQLVSNAVTLTTSTTVTDGIAQLNYVLGKLVPTAPNNFPEIGRAHV